MAHKPWHKIFARNEAREQEEGTAGAPREVAGQGVQLDNPISRGEDDTLERARLASHFAENVLSLDREQGVVVGVIGPWGSGKTSFINLARNTLSHGGAPVLDFNPWMFSGTEQLVDAFFRELAAQLRLKEELASLAGQIEEYGDLFSKFGWLPVFGQFAAFSKPLSSIIGRSLKSRQQGVGHHRARLEKALRALKKPVVVVLDDIDRLSRGEIRDMFKLVRLTARFPNVIYIVAFDRLRVERALSDEDLSGRDYLEKILQVTIDLPPVPFELLGRQVLNSIEEALKDLENAGPFDGGLWPDVFAEIVRPLIRTPRDVRRYAVGLRGTVLALRGEIELTDILALEAIRTFLPDLFQRMHGALAGLTTTADSVRYETERARLKSTIEKLLETSGDHQSVLRAVIIRLFPAARWHIENNHFGSEFKRTWLRERRVAHEDILRLYLERTPTAAFSSFTDAEKAFGLISDGVAFATFLRSLDAQRLQDVISALETFQENFTPDNP